MHKCRCGNDIAAKRFQLGNRTCMECGEREAAVEIEAKQKRVAVAYNKGGLQYMGAPDVARNNLQGTMAAQGRSVVNIEGHNVVPVPTQKSPVKFRNDNSKHVRNAIGIAYIYNDPYWVYSRQDPVLARATRTVFFK